MRTIFIIVIGLGLFSLWGFYSAIRPSKISSQLTPSHFNIPYENVAFKTQDDVLIRGWFIKSQKAHAKTIIVLHGYPADKGDILPVSIFLHNTYNLLYFDFRYLGQSEGRYTSIGHQEILDLQAAIRYLYSRKINEVGVWGFSMGGAVALMTAPTTPAIKSIVAESSYARLDWMTRDYYPLPLLNYVLAELTRFWGWIFLQFDLKDVSPALAAEKLSIPILLIHSEQDEVVPFDHAVLLQKSLKDNPKVEIIFFKNGRHGQHFAGLDKTIQRFFDKSLGVIQAR